MLAQCCENASSDKSEDVLNFRAGEVQIIDFQTQQDKLFPNIALAYALHFTQKYMLQTYFTVYETELSKGNFSSLAEVGCYGYSL